MAFEALNHAGSLTTDLLVILNDNDAPISENVGALSNHIARALSGPLYARLREGGRKTLRQMPTMRELARRSEKHLKGMVLPGTLFEELGFNYIGPVDGHNVQQLVRTLQQSAETARTTVSARRDPQGQGVRPRRGGPRHLARPGGRAMRKPAASSSRKRTPRHLLRGCLRSVGYATWPASIRRSSASRRRSARVAA